MFFPNYSANFDCRPLRFFVFRSSVYRPRW